MIWVYILRGQCFTPHPSRPRRASETVWPIRDGDSAIRRYARTVTSILI
jgi:hypothetical protein